MQAIIRREQVKNNRIVIVTPEEYNHREVDILIIPVKEKKRKFRSLDMISIQTKGLDFNRDELHGR